MIVPASSCARMSSQCAFRVLRQFLHRHPVYARCAFVLLDALEGSEQILSLEYLFPHSPPSALDSSLVSCRGRLGSLVKSQRLHPLRLSSSTPIRGRRPSLLIPRTAQGLSSLSFCPSPCDGMVLWPRLTPAASASSLDEGCGLRPPGDRSPQIRTLTVPAPLPHLLRSALDCIGLRCFLPTRPTVQPRMGFVFLKSQVCFQLPSDPTSR